MKDKIRIDKCANCENDIAEFCEGCEFKFDLFDPTNPLVKDFVQQSISEMFAKYRSGRLTEMDKSEIGVVEICIGFYPNDFSKQENLAFCVIFATMQTDALTFKKVSEEVIMPLAIELGVEDAIIQEILNIHIQKILGENN